jgi:hypothetical protein
LASFPGLQHRLARQHKRRRSSAPQLSSRPVPLYAFLDVQICTALLRPLSDIIRPRTLFQAENAGKAKGRATHRMPDKYKHTAAERNAMLRDLRRVINLKDERELMSFLRAHGIKDENPRFSLIVKAFRNGKIDEILKKKP